MAPVIILLVLILALPWLGGWTFGQQCAKAFEPNTPAHERCVQRMDNGGSVYFEKKIVLTPAK
jgi:hypothetical protein